MELLGIILLLPILALAAPAPGPTPAPSPVTFPPSRTVHDKRDLKGDITSILGGLGSNLPSYITDGVANFFQNFPSGSAVQSSLGLDSSQLAAVPTQVLDLP